MVRVPGVPGLPGASVPPVMVVVLSVPVPITVPPFATVTPLDAAMGLAGGLGFDGKSGAVHEDTANALKEILGDKAVFDPNKKPIGNLRADDPNNRTAVDPN